ncbi:hypothetical protein [Rickettsia felis]|uniref:hypothetical protein n=1 Tax=Rickettsia felis TaxID=42862 RepID=UPI0015854F2D|nr:hypothetical protein [Rickettsia felis]
MVYKVYVLCHSRRSGNPVLITSVSAVNFYNRLLNLFNFFLDFRFCGNDIELCERVGHRSEIYD